MDVLVVDDSAAIRKILVRVLKQTSSQINDVVEAGNGVEAMDILESRQIGLILSDINMPEMDGIELLERVRSSPRWANVPFVLVTTDAGEQRVIDAAERGASAYVRKPFTSEQIKDKLASLFS